MMVEFIPDISTPLTIGGVVSRGAAMATGPAAGGLAVTGLAAGWARACGAQFARDARNSEAAITREASWSM
jgi:hypothetical protein